MKRRNLVLVRHFGEEIPLTDIVATSGINYAALYWRWRQGHRDAQLVKPLVRQKYPQPSHENGDGV